MSSHLRKFFTLLLFAFLLGGCGAGLISPFFDGEGNDLGEQKVDCVGDECPCEGEACPCEGENCPPECDPSIDTDCDDGSVGTGGAGAGRTLF